MGIYLVRLLIVLKKTKTQTQTVLQFNFVCDEMKYVIFMVLFALFKL